MEDGTTPDTQPDASQLNASDGEGTVSTDTISLEALNKAMGKNYKSLDAALAGLEATNQYAGQVNNLKPVLEQVKQALGTDDVLPAIKKLMDQGEKTTQPQSSQGLSAQEVEQIIARRTDENTFFAKNEALTGVKDVLTVLKDSNESTKSMSWSDFVATDVAKKIVEPVVGYQEVQARKSVLESNPRLGTATDRLSTARTALQEARQAAQVGDVTAVRESSMAARRNAVDSVIEAFNL